MELTMVMARTYLKAGKTRKSVALDSFRKSTGYCRRNATRDLQQAGQRCLLGLSVPVTPIASADYPTAARQPAFSVLSNRRLELEHLKTMRSWQDALEDCMEGYKEILQHG